MPTNTKDATHPRQPLVSVQFLQVWVPIALMVASGYFLQDNRVAVIEAEVAAIKVTDANLREEVKSIRADEQALEKLAERLSYMVEHVTDQSDKNDQLQVDLHKIVSILQDRDIRAAKIIDQFDQRIRTLEQDRLYKK